MNDDVLFEIFSRMTITDLARVLCLNKNWNRKIAATLNDLAKSMTDIQTIVDGNTIINKSLINIDGKTIRHGTSTVLKRDRGLDRTVCISNYHFGMLHGKTFYSDQDSETIIFYNMGKYDGPLTIRQGDTTTTLIYENDNLVGKQVMVGGSIDYQDIECSKNRIALYISKFLERLTLRSYE